MVVPVTYSTETASKTEAKGYNRGLILGLTMAESMLLLVFCLLLVAAAIIKAERDKAAAALNAQRESESLASELTREIKSQQVQIAVQDAQIAQLQGQVVDTRVIEAERARLEKEWRELIKADTALRQLEARGFTEATLTESAEIFSRVQQLGFGATDFSSLGTPVTRILTSTDITELTRPHEWPPIINLSEAGGYYFRSGSAELAPDFVAKLQGDIAEQIADNLAQYDVDVIEVIGHTDEQPLSRQRSNLDQALVAAIDGSVPITSVQPADNAGLGMTRALAVVNVLRADPRLKGATILPMSSAQLVLPGDELTRGAVGDVEERRRIEIRIRRRTDG